MIFHLKLLKIAISARKRYLFWAILPALTYLITMATLPYNYDIRQTVVARDNIRLSLGPNPLDMVTVASILKDSQYFFSDNHVLMDLREHLLTSDAINRPEWAVWLPSRFAVFVKRTVLQELALEPAGSEMITIRYQGLDRDLGVVLVNFYTNRLVWAAQRAYERTLMRPELIPEGATPGTDAGIAPQGDLFLETNRVLVTPERLKVAFWLLLTAIIVAMAAARVMEMTRPKFYSERQAARYLDVPILGAIPNLEQMPQLR